MADPELCPRYHHAVELVGARWSGAVLWAMLEGHHRYTDIREAVPGLSDTMLSQRLREFEAERLVERTVHDTTPVQVEYRLTDKGRALAPVVEAVRTWSSAWCEAPAAG